MLAIKKILKAAGADADDASIKKLVASLEGENINDLIASASAVSVAAADYCLINLVVAMPEIGELSILLRAVLFDE